MRRVLRFLNDARHRFGKINLAIALWVTRRVGTMGCAYLFIILALSGLRSYLRPGGQGLVAWLGTVFLQLVLLPIILVGQNAADSHKQVLESQNIIMNELYELRRYISQQNTDIQQELHIIEQGQHT